MNTEFKEGDWVYYAFQLQQIKHISNGRISVSTGRIETSNVQLNELFPISMEIKNCSDAVMHWSIKFHSLDIPGLNHPDLHRTLRAIWVTMCESITHPEHLKLLTEQLDEFGQNVISEVENLRNKSVGGVKLFC